MFSWYKYLIVSLIFSNLGFWSGNISLIANFSECCLLVPIHFSFPLMIQLLTTWFALFYVYVRTGIEQFLHA